VSTADRIRLTATEMMVAGYVGCGRNVQSLTRGWISKTGPHDLWTKNVEGVGGEIAVAKWLKIYWLPIIGDPDADDVGPYQVRTNSSRRFDDTCLRPKDREDRIFISVLSFMPDFEIIGWITGREGKQDCWYRDGTPGYPKCWYVPRHALRPMDQLPSPEEAVLMQGAA
jgi:hypothetical protein